MGDLKIGIIGLGKMGGNLALNMKDAGIGVIGYNRSEERSRELQKQGLEVAFSIGDLVSGLGQRKIVWLMVPQGDAVDENIKELCNHLKAGDIIIDGGNSNFRDSMKRYEELRSISISFMDVGTSGGTNGARYGACMMIGGDEETFEYLKAVFEKVCVENGFGYMGRSGSGHFVKMIHNGIEYAMMQGIGEGFEILEASEFELDFEKVSKVWDSGSIIAGYLMKMTNQAFSSSAKLNDVESIVDSSGEGLWTVEEALKLKVPAPTITQSLYERYRTKKKDSFSAKVVAAQRNQFGGHFLHKKQEEE